MTADTAKPSPWAVFLAHMARLTDAVNYCGQQASSEDERETIARITAPVISARINQCIAAWNDYARSIMPDDAVEAPAPGAEGSHDDGS